MFQYDIFLLHAAADMQDVDEVRSILHAANFRVYCDRYDDPTLDRTGFTAATADRLRARMRRCNAMVYVVTRYASASKWMPWELGFFDGVRGKVLVYPVDEPALAAAHEQEYLSLFKILRPGMLTQQVQQELGKPEPGSLDQQRLFYLSAAELTLSVLALTTSFFIAYVLDKGFDVTPVERLFHALTNSTFLGTFVWLVMNAFSMLLTRRTPLVNLILNQTRRSSVEVDRSADDVGTKQREEALAAIQEAMKVARETSEHDESTATSTKAALDVVQERLSGVEFDAVELEFRQYLFRSGAAASTAQRRPNALLFIGTIIALVGLVFFFVTLPGAGRGLIVVQTASGQANPGHEDFWSSGIQLLPRLLMLVFIQVLAGFFLRQYRASMEDFRYYESILRHREAQYLSYVLRKQSGDRKSMALFAKEIMEDRPLGMLARGQTTTTLEAQRLATNEFASFYEKLAELAMAAKDKATGSKRGDGSKRKKPDQHQSTE
jgi:hypothetical protein